MNCTCAYQKQLQRFASRSPASSLAECLSSTACRCRRVILTKASNSADYVAYSHFLAYLLACSDSPRTGLGIKSLTSIVSPTSPSSGIHLGPYACQIAHIVKLADSDNGSLAQYEGSCDGEMLTSADEWAYKFDSVPIRQRSLVHVLQVQEAWPACLLYLEACPSKQLSFETTFKMQNALVSSVHEKLFPDQGAGAYSQPADYLVWHNWIDRIHHNLLIWFS